MDDCDVRGVWLQNKRGLDGNWCRVTHFALLISVGAGGPGSL